MNCFRFTFFSLAVIATLFWVSVLGGHASEHAKGRRLTERLTKRRTIEIFLTRCLHDPTTVTGQRLQEVKRKCRKVIDGTANNEQVVNLVETAMLPESSEYISAVANLILSVFAVQ